ncbi:Translation initiation factor 3 subunit b [Mortierella sp. NVP41]|nr:Translation initiation factor 3 subunit b [Mortierella sp. NVP41]
MTNIVQNLKQIAKPRPCCSFTPPYVLDQIVESPNVTPESRAVALKTLQRIPAVRKERAKSVWAKAVLNDKFLRVIFDSQQREDLPGKKPLLDDRKGSGPTPTTDSRAKDVYEHFKTVYDFYEEMGKGTPPDTSSYNPFDKNKMFWGSVHFDDDNGVTPGYDNAFWEGTQWAFGDGDNELLGPFTSLDIVAHEMTHAVVQYTANLPYWYQSGALNESIADVFASMVKQYGPKKEAKDADWLIGKDLWLRPGGRALRDMAYPGTAYNIPGVGSDPQPTSMSDPRAIAAIKSSKDNRGVHILSSIPNRAFFLAATSIGGFSWDRTGKIWYEALKDPKLKDEAKKSSFLSNAFEFFANLTVQHAANPDEEEKVRDAWVEVGVLSRVPQ